MASGRAAPSSGAVSDAAHIRDRVRAARLSVVVGLLMLALKMTAYLVTGSSIILSDALESVVHVGATLFMFWCLRVSLRPPDPDHPYGHGKVEHFSVGFEGGMVALAGLAVYWQVGHDLFFGRHVVEDLGKGLWLTGIAAVINLLLGLHLVRTGRRTGSTILVGDGQHVLSDVWTSAGALVGVAVVWLTGLTWLDTAIAALLATYILVTGLRLVAEAVSGLMDKVDPAEVAKVVAAINEIREDGWLDCHHLRVRSNGERVYVDFHLVVPAEWTVERAHLTSEKLEEHILARLARPGEVMVHIDHTALDQYRSRVEDWRTPQPITAASATRAEESARG